MKQQIYNREDLFVKFFDFNILTNLDAISLDGNLKIINTINVHSYCVAKSNPEFKKAMLNSDAIIPDGFGIIFVLRLIYRKKINRIAGWDLHEYILKLVNDKKGTVFYFGSTTNTINKILKRVQKDYPSVRAFGFSPPYKNSFSRHENEKFVNIINSYRPDVLFLGMTAPKQEMWALSNRDYLNVKIIASIGAVFDFYAENVKRAPKLLQKAGLEWFYRSIMEPGRLGKRNIISNPKYFYFILSDILSNKK